MTLEISSIEAMAWQDFIGLVLDSQADQHAPPGRGFARCTWQVNLSPNSNRLMRATGFMALAV
jgi:hypothetical protein